MALNSGRLVFVAVVALLIANYFLFVPISTRRTYRKHKALHRPYTYSWSETGLAITSSSGEWHVAWSDYLKWDENALVFILYQAPRLFNILPKRALTPEQIVAQPALASDLGRVTMNSRCPLGSQQRRRSGHCARSEKGQKQTNTIDRQASIGDQGAEGQLEK